MIVEDDAVMSESGVLLILYLSAIRQIKDLFGAQTGSAFLIVAIRRYICRRKFY